MILSPRLQKVALLAHVTTSIGWLGAVASFVALAVAGLTSMDPQVVRAAYVGMDLITWSVIAPLALASPLTGVLSSLGTTWGLFRYYWVVVKIVMTIPATIVLFIHAQPIGYLAHVAGTAAAGPDVDRLRTQLLVAAVAAIVVLFVITALSVFKPRGRTGVSF